MTMTDKRRGTDAGSRMHLLDWLASPLFLPALRAFVAPIGFSIPDNAARRPGGRHDHRESTLVGRNDSFLSRDQQQAVTRWWLVHPARMIPNWDLVVSAVDASGAKVLILVEAKAHATELDEAGKLPSIRPTPEEQKRTDDNHDRIAAAIAEANAALATVVPGISISRDKSYQFANRVAFAWKLASLGVPVALIYLGFVGDTAIARPGDCLRASADWQAAFARHVNSIFAPDNCGRPINCGAASFWLLVETLEVLRQSPALDRRRSLARVRHPRGRV